MRTPRRVDLATALSGLLAAVSIAYILAFVLAGYFRITYAYPLAPMEAPVIQAVRRILQGQPLYGPPGLDYVPTLYTPLYFYVSALAARLLGPSLMTLRLISLIASLGSAALIGHLVWRETRHATASVVAAGLFVCSTSLAETILDLARVDALGVFLILAGLDLARAADVRPPRQAVWLTLSSGVVVGLAILTKQTALAVAGALTVQAVLSRSPLRLVAFVAGAGVAVGVAAATLVAQYGAWPELYLVELPRQHAFQLEHLEGFWSKQLLPGFTLPLVGLGVFVVGRLAQRDLAGLQFWMLATLGLLGMAWGASLNRWAGDNVLAPAFAIASAGFGLGLAEGLRRLEAVSRPARMFRGYLLVLGVAEFAFVFYNPRYTSPLRSDVDAGQRMVAAIRALPGAVYGPEFPELVYQAGRGEQAFGLSVGELEGMFGGRPRPQGTLWTTAYAEALDERRYDEVLLESEAAELFLTDSTRDHGYVDTGPLIPAGDEFYRLDSRFMPRLHVWVPGERVGH
ncbi:MAG TPA: glycosyltransferase family 39 protein [Chloroflexota bacterium]